MTSGRLGRLAIAAVAVVGLAVPGLLAGAAANPAAAAAGARSRAAAAAGLSRAEVQRQQWWIGRLSLRKVWRITRGAGVTVAVIDTGVDKNFGDLRGAVGPGFIANGPSGGAPRDSDPNLHGTRIADEIAGRGTGFGLLGVAPRARILPVQHRDSREDDDDGTSAALNRLSAMTHPPQVVNMSYGAPLDCPDSVQAAVRRAVAAGMVLVASAGNVGDTGNLSYYPANCPGVIAVGAVNESGRDWAHTERQAYVSLAGPGVEMIGYNAQADSGYGYADGTSDSAAIVSGVIALVRARYPTMSARQVVTRVLATTHQFDGKQGSRNNRSGYGVALPLNALTGHVPADAPNPVYDALGASSPSGAPSSSDASSAAGEPGGASDPAGSPDSSSTPPAAARADSGGSNTGLIIGIAVAVVVVIGIVALVTMRSRRRAVHGAGWGPPPGGGGYGPPPGGGYGPPPGGGYGPPPGGQQ